MKGAEAAYILNKSRARILCSVGEFLGASFVAMLADPDLGNYCELADDV